MLHNTGTPAPASRLAIRNAMPSRQRLMMIVMVAALMAIAVMPAAAQTATATPNINLDLTSTIESFFNSISTFMPVFAPIIALGVGISVSLALLGFLGKQLLGAFRGGGGK